MDYRTSPYVREKDMSTTTMAAYYCVSGPYPYFCVTPDLPPYSPFNPPPAHPPCGCQIFTPEPMPADLMRKLIKALERNGNLLRKNKELQAELAELKRQLAARPATPSEKL